LYCVTPLSLVPHGGAAGWFTVPVDLTSPRPSKAPRPTTTSGANRPCVPSSRLSLGSAVDAPDGAATVQPGLGWVTRQPGDCLTRWQHGCVSALRWQFLPSSSYGGQCSKFRLGACRLQGGSTGACGPGQVTAAARMVPCVSYRDHIQCGTGSRPNGEPRPQEIATPGCRSRPTARPSGGPGYPAQMSAPTGQHGGCARRA